MTARFSATKPSRLVFVAVVALALGAAGTYVVMRRSMVVLEPRSPEPSQSAPGTPTPATASMATSAAEPLPDVAIMVTDEGVRRAGIKVAPVVRSSEADSLRMPGIVEPNAYRQVVVTPLVAGRVTDVSAALGDQVARGQPLAQIYSPELPDTQTRYLTMGAELAAAHERLRRTERLVEIGAASVQELEKARADHTTHATDVEGARARLMLFGFTADQIDGLRTASDVTATVTVPAPLSGVVIERQANVGLNVDLSSKLFNIVDLSTVWVVAELHERDFARVRVGSAATVTTTAYPGLSLRSRVSYLDPQVSPETRTARLRVEVPNAGQRLRLGMYVDVAVDSVAAAVALMVPRRSVQALGNRQVVYLADPKQPGRFVEREVRLGEASGEHVQVMSGVAAGDVVVAEGSFSLRAERDRLGLRATSSAGAGSSPPSGLQQAKVTVGDAGYEPATLTLRAGVPARITFVRTSEQTCGTEVFFPSLSIKKTLPLNEPVAIDFTPEKAGDIAFVCGMNMLNGRIVVVER